MVENYNVSSQFLAYAQSHPNKIAFVEPIAYDHHEVKKEKILTYGEFHQKVSNYRAGLLEEGFKKGDKIIILCPINIEFYACMLAMLSLGLVAVFLDPGIGVKKILTAIKDSNSQGIVSLHRVLRFWYFIPSLWSMKKYSVDKTTFGLKKFNQLHKPNSSKDFEVAHLKANDHVLVTFTSGSTGRSKGADRNAKNLYQQLQVIRSNWACDENQVDFPIFLMFGFMNLLCGITTVLPAADYRQIGKISPEVIVKQMRKWKITRMSGSYTFNKKVADYLQAQGMTITSLKNLVLGGTPVTKEFCELLNQVYPASHNLMTYGSTEVAPISFCPLEDLVTHTYQGSFVGKPCEELDVKIVSLPDRALDFSQEDVNQFSKDLGDWGEVIIRGPHVVQNYLDNPEADRINKIPSNQGDKWHRTGDTGYLDQAGNLILTGRLSDIIHINEKEIHPYPIELKLETIAGINRGALVQKNNNIVVAFDGEGEQLEELIQKALEEFELPSFAIQKVPKIPLDDRHNSKVNRIKLREIL